MVDTKILVCDDHPVFRYGLKALLEKDGFYVFETRDASEAISMAIQYQPDLIIMDYILPKMTGLHVIEEIQRKGLQKKAILLSSVYEEGLIEKCRQLKINGYISKSESLETICFSISQVITGEWLFIEPVADNMTEENHSENPFHVLTHREIEVVHELTTGKTQQKISEKLCVSVRTVEKHRENITQKLGKMSLAELTKKAFIWGLIPDNR